MTPSRRVRLHDFSPVRGTACGDVAGCVHVGVLSEAARRATERGLVRPAPLVPRLPRGILRRGAAAIIREYIEQHKRPT
jgi:hypothetical protein